MRKFGLKKITTSLGLVVLLALNFFVTSLVFAQSNITSDPRYIKCMQSADDAFCQQNYNNGSYDAVDLSNVRLSISPASGVIVGQTSVTFTITNVPGNSTYCIVDLTDSTAPPVCATNSSPGTRTVTMRGTEDKEGVHQYSVAINGQSAPNAVASVTVTQASGIGLPSAPTIAPSGISPYTGAAPIGTTPAVGSAAVPGDCGYDPNLVWDANAKICLPKSQSCTSGSIACASSLSDLIIKVIEYLLFFGGIVAVLFIVVGGFWYITAAGNEEQAEKGKTALVNAIIGVVLISLAFLIVRIISNTLNSGNVLGN